MISYILGQIKSVDAKSLTILTSSGVGYKVYVSLSFLLLKKENEEIELLIRTIVKDDAIDLYGFESKDELSLFESLITVSKIGPRSALSILSTASLESIVQAIETEDAEILAKVPGIGKRTSEKIIIELKGKLGDLQVKEVDSKHSSNESDARLALESFGYSEKDITKALKTLHKERENFDTLNPGEIIKEVLKLLN